MNPKTRNSCLSRQRIYSVSNVSTRVSGGILPLRDDHWTAKLLDADRRGAMALYVDSGQADWLYRKWRPTAPHAP
jgi:hypothetical protein